MAEDMTYEPVQTVAQLAARVQELKRENAELRARLDAVQEYAEYYSADIALFAITGNEPMTFDEWLADAQPDDTDAPLTLAPLDEDGDE